MLFSDMIWKRVDQWKDKNSLKTDAALSQVLKIGQSDITKYRSGEKGMGWKLIAKILLTLDIEFADIFPQKEKQAPIELPWQHSKDNDRMIKVLLDRIDELEEKQKKSPFQKTV